MIVYPKKRDVIIIDAEPHSGREAGGHDPSKRNIRRHMVVMSPQVYSSATGLILGMPITTADKSDDLIHYKPILINGSHGDGVKGWVSLWQLQNFDFDSRNGVIINTVDERFYNELLPYVKDMLDL